MLTIRLQRTGKRNQSDFRVVVAEKTAAASKKFTEVLGSYNPKTKVLVIRNKDRLQYWIGQRLQLSPTIHNLFVTKEIIKEPKVKAFRVKKKEAAKEAVASAAPSATTAAEAPQEIPPTETPTEEPATTPDTTA